MTVVIPVFNHWRITARCLQSLFACDPDVAIQVVVVDDGSTDETPRQLLRLPGVQVVRNGRNCGFVQSCNRGASLARASLILFLNNDTELAYGALRSLVRRLRRSDDIGIVGSKLVYPDGRLQEAGNIVWSDATGWNYGRLDRADKFEYNFSRDVDYVSGAALLVRTELFHAVGGFDSRFSPGYYEDADLCFAVRAIGKRVVYEPTSVVVHHEGATSGTDLSAGMKRFQSINKVAFRSKWAEILEREHVTSDPRSVFRAARMRHGAKRSLLVIDSYVPLYDKEAGSNRLKRLIDGFSEAGLRIVFLPDNLTPLAPYTQQLQSNGVEVIYEKADRPRSWSELLIETLQTVDVAWICRPDLVRKYLPTVRENVSIPILYDTIDLHHLRLRRQAETEGSGDDLTWRRVERLELACANAADRTIVVSDYEANLVKAAGVSEVAVVPTVHDLEMSRTLGYKKTTGLLFIGGYNHTPNRDAAIWLIREIMPRIWAKLPDVVVTLLGSNPTQAVYDLASERVIVPGFVNDHQVARHFRAARVFVAPLRYGAGLKGKIGQALGFGTPIVSTSTGIEGFHLVDGVSALVANDAATFASSVVRLYGDAALWAQLSAASPDALEPFRSARVVRNALAVVHDVLDSEQNLTRHDLAAASGTSILNESLAVDEEPERGEPRGSVNDVPPTDHRQALRREAELYLAHENLQQHARELSERIGFLNAELENRDATHSVVLTSMGALRRVAEEAAVRTARAEQELREVQGSKAWRAIAPFRLTIRTARRLARRFTGRE